MPYTLTITGDTFEEVRDQAVQLLNMGASVEPSKPSKVVVEKDEEPEVEKPKAEKPKAKKPKAKKAEPESDDETEAVLDFDKDVAPIVVELVTKKGREVVENILEEYGVSRASQIEDSVLPEFVEKIKAELG